MTERPRCAWPRTPLDVAYHDREWGVPAPTICCALMQATGMVNDHLVTCFRHAELAPRAP